MLVIWEVHPEFDQVEASYQQKGQTDTAVGTHKR